MKIFNLEIKLHAKHYIRGIQVIVCIYIAVFMNDSWVLDPKVLLKRWY